MTTTTNSLNNDSHDAYSNTMKTLKELFAYEHWTTRIVFNSDDTEVVFVNESLISRVQIYIDGELKVSGFHFWSDLTSHTQFEHADRQYRLISRTTNWITMAQEVTLYVDGQEVATKIDPRLAALSWKQRVHFVAAMAGIGLAIGLLVGSL